MVKKCDKETVLRNIRRVNGQVSGIEKMVQEDRDITEVLQQVTAASSALKSVGKLLLEDYANGCFNQGKGHSEKELQKLIAHLFKTL